jgi:hypothetical protein
MRLTIIRIKPNPAGKDHPAHGSPNPSQLAGEWVDFRNDAGQDVPLGNISLWHLAYGAGHAPEWEKVTGFTGTLPAGKIVRSTPASSGRSPSSAPRIRRAPTTTPYRARRHVWNNKQGDSPLLSTPCEADHRQGVLRPEPA